MFGFGDSRASGDMLKVGGSYMRLVGRCGSATVPAGVETAAEKCGLFEKVFGHIPVPGHRPSP